MNETDETTILHHAVSSIRCMIPMAYVPRFNKRHAVRASAALVACQFPLEIENRRDKRGKSERFIKKIYFKERSVLGGKIRSYRVTKRGCFFEIRQRRKVNVPSEAANGRTISSMKRSSLTVDGRMDEIRQPRLERANDARCTKLASRSRKRAKGWSKGPLA